MKKLRGERKQDAAMDQAKFCGVAAAMIGSAVVGAGASAYSANKNAKAAQAGTQQQIDPRMQQVLYGSSDPNAPLGGLLGQYQGMLNSPQSSAANAYASSSGDYLKQYGGQDLSTIHNAATGLMQGNSAPMAPAALVGAASASLPAYAVGSMVDAPAQNSVDLTGTFQSMLNGGNNQALRDSLTYGTDLTNAQFAKNQTDVTNNLTRNVLPGIQGGAIAAGQYGSSRQGIAEGNALSDYTNQLTNANTQLGLANSANTTGQLASDYQQGQSRALAAAQGLSQQQYTTALQDANTKNQAEFMNVGNSYDVSKTNAGLQQQTNLANLGTTQQTNMANQASQLQTNAQNNAGVTTGAGMLGGLLGQANSGLNAGTGYAQGVNSLIQPYLGANQTTTQPYYANTASNVMGGALMGSQLGSLFGGSTGSGSSLANMKGSTSASLGGYNPSSSGIDWGSMSSLYS